jgi:hypothetical protein
MRRSGAGVGERVRPESNQTAYAERLTQQLFEDGFEDITLADILDALGSTGLRLEPDPSGDASIAYQFEIAAEVAALEAKEKEQSDE